MYHIREVVLKNKTQTRKRPIIEFDDPDQAIVGELLMVDAPLENWAILHAIDKVMDGKIPVNYVSGNRFGAEITVEKTYLYDLFSDLEGVPAYSDYALDTETLRELIIMWEKEVRKYHEK